MKDDLRWVTLWVRPPLCMSIHWILACCLLCFAEFFKTCLLLAHNFSWIDQSLFSKYSKLGQGMPSLPFILFVHFWLITNAKLVWCFFIICSQLVHELFANCLQFVQLVLFFSMTCSWLVHNCLRTYCYNHNSNQLKTTTITKVGFVMKMSLVHPPSHSGTQCKIYLCCYIHNSDQTVKVGFWDQQQLHEQQHQQHHQWQPQQQFSWVVTQLKLI